MSAAKSAGTTWNPWRWSGSSSSGSLKAATAWRPIKPPSPIFVRGRRHPIVPRPVGGTGRTGWEAPQAAIADLREGPAPSDRPKAGRGDWANGLDVRRLPEEKAAVLFHAGCRFSFDQQAQPPARAALQLLSRGGVEVGIFGDRETCC